MIRILALASMVLAAAPALAERPADVLARLRGTPSTNTGALGSDFPQQYVDAYRFRPHRPVYVIPPCQPPVIVLVGQPVASTTLSLDVDAGPVSAGGVWTTRARGAAPAPSPGRVLAAPLRAPAPAATRP